MPPLPQKAYWPPAYIYLQSVAIAAVVWYFSRGFYIDDAFISLRYAQNLLSGHGLTWNPGDRVEGYTNFLFILLTAGLGWLGMDLVLASRVISFAAFFGIIAVIALYVRAARPTPSYADRVCAALAVGLVISSAPLLIWCFGGLEGNLFAFFLIVGACLMLRLLQGGFSRMSALGIGTSFALATLTRPDGALFSIYTLGFLGGLWLLPYTRSRIRFADALAAGLAFGVIIIPYTVWRLSYFGEWLPNTYYAKIYGIDRMLLWKYGFDYALYYLLAPPFLFLIAAWLLFKIVNFRKITPHLLYLYGLAGLILVYVTKVGGDSLGPFRFMLPLVPVLTLLVYHGGLLLIERNEKSFRDLSTILLVFSFFQIGVIQSLPVNLNIRAFPLKDYVNSHWPKGSLVALNGAGALPYYAPDYRYIDMLGLLDKHIARRLLDNNGMRYPGYSLPGHMKGDGAYVLSREPDYIVTGSLAWGNEDIFYLGDAELMALPDFSRRYRKKEAYIDPPPAIAMELRKMHEQDPEKARKTELLWDIPPLTENNQWRFMYYERIK